MGLVGWGVGGTYRMVALVVVMGWTELIRRDDGVVELTSGGGACWLNRQ